MKKTTILILTLITAACSGNKSTAPTPAMNHQSTTKIESSFGLIQPQIASAVSSAFSSCLAGPGASSCFTEASYRARSVVNAAAIATPLNLVASSNGSNVTLTWSAVNGSVAYIIEAGSASGLANLATFSTGNSQTTFAASGIGTGAYYVRVRAVGVAGDVSAPSNETLLVVAGSGSCVAPGSPSGLSIVSVAAGTVMLAWSPAAGNPTSYVVEAGSSPGAANLANSDLGGPAPSMTATGVGAGLYYVRVRGKNACGLSGPSNEVVLTVGGVAPTPVPTPTPTPTPIPTPRGSFSAGQYLVGRDIAAGRYFTVPSYGCYWERQSGLGGRLADILSNEFVGFDAAQWIVDILPSDFAFKTERSCGSWFNTPVQGFQGNIRAGVWLVGAQIAPGTYRAAAQYGCYWERRRNFTGALSAIIANDFVSSAGPQLVSISTGDAGFYTDADCGAWTRVSSMTTEALPLRPGSESAADIPANLQLHRSRSDRLLGR